MIFFGATTGYLTYYLRIFSETVFGGSIIAIWFLQVPRKDADP